MIPESWTNAALARSQYGEKVIAQAVSRSQDIDYSEISHLSTQGTSTCFLFFNILLPFPVLFKVGQSKVWISLLWSTSPAKQTAPDTPWI